MILSVSPAFSRKAILPSIKAREGVSSFSEEQKTMNRTVLPNQVAFLGSISLNSKQFEKERMDENNPKWSKAISRITPLDKKEGDIRSEFERDRNRIMYSEGFDRLRFKTQAFTNPQNDMISSRSSHVSQVADISRNITRKLGLNEDLAEVIAQGHDIGHAPFGHDGERSLCKIAKEHNLAPFWHERNSLKMVDKLLLLTDEKGRKQNLSLTYAVRDGIINHCGEIDENFIKPRENFVDLDTLSKPAHVRPYTWEGIVVRLSDTIAYLGKDIEDAFKLGVLKENHQEELNKIVKTNLPDFKNEVNNTSLISLFVTDIVKNSSPEKGIGYSDKVFKTLKDIKKFNYDNIYKNKDKDFKQEHSDEIINTIFNHYSNIYNGAGTIKNIQEEKNVYTKNFKEWLSEYAISDNRDKKYNNLQIYNLEDKNDYKQAVVDYISGMTDKYASKVYEDIKSNNQK